MTLRRDCLRPCTGIWSRPVDEDDLLKWESLVIGPALSPYAFGFFTFRMQVLAPFLDMQSFCRVCPQSVVH